MSVDPDEINGARLLIGDELRVLAIEFTDNSYAMRPSDADSDYIASQGYTGPGYIALESQFDIVINYDLPFEQYGIAHGEVERFITLASAASAIGASADQELRSLLTNGQSSVAIAASGSTELPTPANSAEVASEIAAISVQTNSQPVTSGEANSAIAAMSAGEMALPVTHALVAVAIVGNGASSLALVTDAWLRNLTYNDNGMADLPIWSFEPDWNEGMRETLEWLTRVLASQTGAEQRSCMRATPRRTLEFDLILSGRERSFFDQMLITHGARDWYLPLWYDVHLIESDIPNGSNFIPCLSAMGHFQPNDTVAITTDTFSIEVNQVAAVTPEGIHLDFGILRDVPDSARVYLVKRARLREQPDYQRLSDDTIGSTARFQVVDVNDHDEVEILDEISGARLLLGDNFNGLALDFTDNSYAVRSMLGSTLSSLDSYRGFPVIDIEPDANEDLQYGYDRLIEELDNQTGLPVRIDTANLAFPKQHFGWLIHGRREHEQFLNLIYFLKGRFAAAWMPTFFNDFAMVSDTPAGESYIVVENIGFGVTGGPREGRREIVIQFADGTSLYRRVMTNTTDTKGNEIISVDQVFATGLQMADVVRISFMSLVRMDQDNVEIAHLTDMDGLAKSEVAFRSAPDLRVEMPGFAA